MKNYLRRTWAEVNIDALKHNFDAIRAAADRKARIICVIKADAYGHGAVFLGKLYEKMGADGFAVSNIEEAMQLRENGIHLPVLILGFTPASLAGELAVHHISQAVFSEEYARELSAEAVKQNV
ncbi:MAG: alanine racemase, partial [Acutalibacteraceae bacterium]|nr:alanine racemase [Acutalibacteraceae bacterium]